MNPTILKCQIQKYSKNEDVAWTPYVYVLVKHNQAKIQTRSPTQIQTDPTGALRTWLGQPTQTHAHPQVMPRQPNPTQEPGWAGWAMGCRVGLTSLMVEVSLFAHASSHQANKAYIGQAKAGLHY